MKKPKKILCHKGTNHFSSNVNGRKNEDNFKSAKLAHEYQSKLPEEKISCPWNISELYILGERHIAKYIVKYNEYLCADTSEASSVYWDTKSLLAFIAVTWGTRSNCLDLDLASSWRTSGCRCTGGRPNTGRTHMDITQVSDKDVSKNYLLTSREALLFFIYYFYRTVSFMW